VCVCVFELPRTRQLKLPLLSAFQCQLLKLCCQQQTHCTSDLCWRAASAEKNFQPSIEQPVKKHVQDLCRRRKTNGEDNQAGSKNNQTWVSSSVTWTCFLLLDRLADSLFESILKKTQHDSMEGNGINSRKI